MVIFEGKFYGFIIVVFVEVCILMLFDVKNLFFVCILIVLGWDNLYVEGIN